MVVGYDAKRFYHNFSGLGNYSRSLVDNLSLFYPQHQYQLYINNAREHSLTQPITERPNVQVKESSFSSWMWRTLLMTRDFDPAMQVFHGLSHELPMRIHRHPDVKKIVTICDLIYSKYPVDFPWFDRQVYHQKILYGCKHADHIIAISTSTKNDIIQHFQVDPDRISVIYPSLDIRYTDSKVEVDDAPALNSLPEDYLLYVGSITYRKNLITLLKAMKIVASELTTPLVVVGNGKKYKQQSIDYLSKNGLEDRVIWLSGITNDELPMLYEKALGTVYPSYYEGFGLPIVESLAMGTPVITSKTSSMPEAGGEGALYIDPSSPEELSEAISQLVQDENLQRTLAEKGAEHIKQFDPQLCADSLMSTYHKVLGA